MLKIFLLFVLAFSVVSAEFDEFGYSNEPPVNNYPRTQRTIPAKQVIIQNRKTITALQRRVAELEERIDGLTSLVEGLNGTIAELRMASSMMPAASSAGTDNTALIKELGMMIDKINASYVSKEELQSMLNGKKLKSTKKRQAASRKSSASNESLKGKPTAKIYSEGVRLFVKHRYDEAEKRFLITDKKGYKPAASNYYLGEIAYYTKKYEDAIFFYKKSAGLYDQASYIDVLLLHTAISLEKTGDKSQARTFYKNIIENYPDRKTAKIAKEKLKKL